MPVDLRQLVGQEEAARRMSAMLARGRLPHALLFMGPAGVGKLAAARVLAQLLMCTERRSGDLVACDQCPACHKVREALHADVHVVTTEARTLKVDEIREAARTLHLRPFEASVKVLIIQGADRMTVEAQNALLKTLEEPPGSSHIILTTSRPRALLPTVLSRAQRVPFRPIDAHRIADVLVEKKSMPEAQALLVASMSQGSLEQAFEIDPAELIEQRDRIASLDLRLAPGGKNALYEALEASTDLGNERSDLEAVLDLLLVWLHDQIVLAAGADPRSITNVDRRADLEARVSERGLRTLLERTQVVMHAKRQLDLPFNLNQQMIAEALCLGLSGQVRVPESAERR